MANADALNQSISSVEQDVTALGAQEQQTRDKVDAAFNDLKAQLAAAQQANPGVDLSAVTARVEALDANLKPLISNLAGYDPNDQTGINASGQGEQPAGPPTT